MNVSRSAIAGRDLRRDLVGRVAARVVEQPGADELGDAVDEPRAAHADRRDVADHLERQLAVGDLHALDRAVGGAHPAADLRGLERGAGGRGGGDDAVLVAERDLRVRPDVDEQPQPAVAGQPGGEHPGDDVAADVGAERREREGRRARVDGHAEVGRGERRRVVRGDHERRHRERLGVDPERELRHRHVAAERDLVDLARVDARLGADLLGELRERLLRARLERVERALVHHRRADPGDHVGAERLLAVEHRADRGGRPGLEVEQRRDDRRRPEVEGDREAPRGRVARLDVDQLFVADHRGDVPVGAPEDAAERPQHRQPGVRREVLERVLQALEVRALVLHRRLGQHEVALLHRRAAGSRGGRRRRAPPSAASAAAAPRSRARRGPARGRRAASRRAARPA